ncbi:MULTISPECIES: hypothetical protein [Microbulbifer]|uniref:hypothetical protein n=1 Tax=Microbulbifer TaxID=48073 RepID=UPI001E635EC6|nr:MULTISPECIES: hypothetical protein [Microbulbifer]UHQ53710.1 hypothetical protein LVE68_09295 [Microbulbifer sp. YPW16]
MYRIMIAAALGAAVALSASSAMAKPNNDLPPGLQKKAERGGELPPGWKKKLQVGHVLEHDIYSHAVIVKPVDRHGLVTVSIEGEIVRLMHHSREIVEILSH